MDKSSKSILSLCATGPSRHAAPIEQQSLNERSKRQIRELLNKMPHDDTLEDLQYHLYVLEKLQRGIARAETEGAMSQDEVEKHFSKWTTE
ncbi:MAG: hypothetical protein ACYC7I_08675 [Gammaproteobacteria bacterium]